jgi:hypothetical protein
MITLALATIPGPFKPGWAIRTHGVRARSVQRFFGATRLIARGSRDWLGIHKYPDAAALKLYGEAVRRVYGPLV